MNAERVERRGVSAVCSCEGILQERRGQNVRETDQESERNGEGDERKKERRIERREVRRLGTRERGGVRGAVRNAWERGASGPTAICPSRIPPTPRRALRLFSAPRVPGPPATA